MPALPGAHLILIHADFALASFKTRFNTGTCFDHPRQFCQRRFFERHLGPIRRREVIMVAMLGVLIGGIARGTGLEGPVVRQGTTGDHQPLLGSWAFALDPRLHPAPHHLDGHIPSDLVVDHWTSDGESSSHRDVLLPHDVWTTSNRLSGQKITSTISIA
jgi:hypothetical protein